MTEGGPKRRPNTVVFATIAVLVALLAIGAVVETVKKEKGTPMVPTDNARAVLVAAADGVDRRIVVSPCDTPLDQTRNDVEAGRQTPGATQFVLPAGTQPRAVLVPDCVKPSNAANAQGNLPSAAFVLPIGAEGVQNRILMIGAQTQILVPADSRAENIVVPPCTDDDKAPEGNRPGDRDVILSPSESDTASAPTC